MKSMKIRKISIAILCVIMGMIFARYSENKLVWFLVGLMILSLLVQIAIPKLEKKILAFSAIVIILLSGVYFVKELFPYIWSNDSSVGFRQAQISTQRDGNGNDMWISMIMENKTANLTYATPWIWDYFELFSEDTASGERKQNDLVNHIWQYVSPEDVMQIGNMNYMGTRHLFPEDVIETITTNEIQPRLYLDVAHLAEAEEVYVLTDEMYNIYMISEELMSAVLEKIK